MARVLGIDIGTRRVGLAISDASGTLARPLATIRVTNAQEAVDRVMREIARLGDEDGGLAQIVVGIPRRLDGTETDETRRAEAFVAAMDDDFNTPAALAALFDLSHDLHRYRDGVSRGEKTPWRLKLRSASFNNVQVLPELLRGALLADMVAVLGSMFFVVGDIDK